jgi:hypothetical protein
MSMAVHNVDDKLSQMMHTLSMRTKFYQEDEERVLKRYQQKYEYQLGEFTVLFLEI